MLRAPVVHLPTQFDGLALSGVISEFSSQCGGVYPAEIDFDFSRMNFVKPAGIAFLSNFVHWLNAKGTNVVFSGLDITKSPVKYLDDSLFFEQHLGSRLDVRSSPRSTTQPLQRISQSGIHAWLESIFVPWLSAKIGVTEQSLRSFRICISELFNNINDHTRYDIGSIFAQYFPAENSIHICISDFGRGIPESVRTVAPGCRDPIAILKAFEEGFSSRSTVQNRGAGLDFLLRTAVIANGGSVMAYSLGGIVSFTRINGVAKGRVVASNGFCPGTTINIVLKTDAITNVLEENFYYES